MSTSELIIAPVIKGLRLEIVTTANLPAAGAKNDGLVLIENKGTGDQNLIIYSQGLRYRLDGGSPF